MEHGGRLGLDICSEVIPGGYWKWDWVLTIADGINGNLTCQLSGILLGKMWVTKGKDKVGQRMTWFFKPGKTVIDLYGKEQEPGAGGP